MLTDTKITSHHRNLTSRPWRKAGVLILVALISILFGIGAQETFARHTPIKMIIDTDAGVDDAAALAWLLSQDRYPIDILGVTTVAGNTSVENATNNVLTLLDAVGQRDIPVVIGAGEPLVQPLSHTPSLIHGPDGLWFVGLSNPHDLSGLPDDVPAFYRDMALAQPEATLLVLGPATNLAQAVTRYPDEMQRFAEIIVLGGAKDGGNQTPVAEFNFWQDPEAAAQVLAADLPITLIPLDTFSQFTLTQRDIDRLAQRGTAVAQLIAGPLQLYADVQTGLGGQSTAPLPDVAAAMYAANRRFGRDIEPALVKIVIEDSLARGQSIVGITFGERITMIADDAELSALADQVFTDPTFDLEGALLAIFVREPTNADVVFDINQRQMRNRFVSELAR